LKAGRRPAGPSAPIDGLERRAVLIAASTQPGEEDAVLDACDTLWAEHPGVLLLVAPDAIPAFTIPGTGSMSPADPMSP